MKEFYSALAVVVSLVALCAVGCKTVVQAQQIDDLFCDWGYTVNHHELFATAILKEGVTREVAVAALRTYLEEKPGALRPKEDPISGPIRARDFWALVLSNLTTGSLAIYTQDSEQERERGIKTLLSKCPH
jgi:hypothetical protein